jgi:hypothetical protein
MCRSGKRKTSLDLSLSYAASPRLTLGASINAVYTSEPNFASNVGPTQRAGNYFATADGLSAAYQWSRRFSTVSTYSFRLVRYQDSSTAAFSDRQENTLGEEFRFDLLRDTVLVADYPSVRALQALSAYVPVFVVLFASCYYVMDQAESTSFNVQHLTRTDTLYFTLTGLHMLHVAGGMAVNAYFWGPGAKLWKSNPEWFTNRVEHSGLFWHFVDLVWIFLFPTLYLL